MPAGEMGFRLQCERPGFDPWVGKIPWRRERPPSPVFWPGEFHGLCSPWPRKELDRTKVTAAAERLSLFTTEENINMQHFENTEHWNGVKSPGLAVSRPGHGFGLKDQVDSRLFQVGEPQL